MNIKTFFLLSLLFSNTAQGMKRQLTNPATSKKNKKTKFDTPSASLCTFFASNTQLKKAWWKIRCDNPYKGHRSQKIVANTPLDIKKMIAQQSIFYRQEWWYTTHKRSYQTVPYGISFLDDDTLIVGLNNKKLEIINLITNERLLSFKTHKTILSLAKNTTENIIACGFNDNTVELFKIHKIEADYTIEPLREFTTNSKPWALAFTDTDDIAVGHDDGTVICFSPLKKELFSHKENSRVYGLIKNTNQQSFTCGLITGTLFTYNIQTNSSTLLPHPIGYFDQLYSLSSNSNGTKYAIGTDEGVIYFTNTASSHTTKSFDLHSSIFSLALNSTGNHLAAGLHNKTVHLLKHYTSPTPDQTMLREAVKLYFQVKKPHKSITSIHSLLYIIAYQFKLNHQELINIWDTFPPEIQDAIWLNAQRIIKQHGKKQSTVKEFCTINNLSTIQLPKAPFLQQYKSDKKTIARHKNIREILCFLRMSQPRTTMHIDSLDSLFTTVSVLFNLRKAALNNIWDTFPETAQSTLLNYYIPSQKS